MLIRQLEYLIALAREKHFGRAATACWVSQPALSEAIRNLETEFGVPIVRRRRRYDGLTPEGERLLAWAHRVLAERDEIITDFGSNDGRLKGQLRIGAIPTALPPLPIISGALLSAQPDVTLMVTSLTSSNIVRQLQEFELDIGLTYIDRVESHDLQFIPLYIEHYLLLTPAQLSPTIDHRHATWAHAATLPLCLLTPDMQNRRILDAQFQAGGSKVVPRLETSSLSLLSAHIRTGTWASVLPQSWLQLFALPPGVRLHRLPDPEMPSVVGFMVPARKPLPATVEALLNVVSSLDLQTTLDSAMTQVLVSNQIRSNSAKDNEPDGHI